jgi:hypothetical protein
VARLDRGDAKRDQGVALAAAGGADQVDVPRASGPLEGGEVVERGVRDGGGAMSTRRRSRPGNAACRIRVRA